MSDASKNQSPNIVFIIAERARTDVYGCYGQQIKTSPVLDELAKRGVLFSQAFSACPESKLGAAILAKGRYYSLYDYQEAPLIDTYLQQAGYQCGHKGEFNGHYEPEMLEHITDSAINFIENRDRSKPFYLTVSYPSFLQQDWSEPNPEMVTISYNEVDISKWSDRVRDLFVKTKLPPDLLCLRGECFQSYPPMLEHAYSIDSTMGRIIDKLEELSLTDNTVVIFSAISGDHLRTRNRDVHCFRKDYYQSSCHDNTLQVPLVIAGGPFKGGITDTNLVSTISIPSTILKLANVQETNPHLPGIDLSTTIAESEKRRIEREEYLKKHEEEYQKLYDETKKKAEEEGEEFVPPFKFDPDLEPLVEGSVFAQLSSSRQARIIRTAHYTYSAYVPANAEGKHYPRPIAYQDDLFYDNVTDPTQVDNLIRDGFYKKIKLEMRQQLQEYLTQNEGYTPDIIEAYPYVFDDEDEEEQDKDDKQDTADSENKLRHSSEISEEELNQSELQH